MVLVYYLFCVCLLSGPELLVLWCHHVNLASVQGLLLVSFLKWHQRVAYQGSGLQWHHPRFFYVFINLQNYNKKWKSAVQFLCVCWILWVHSTLQRLICWLHCCGNMAECIVEVESIFSLFWPPSVITCWWRFATCSTWGRFAVTLHYKGRCKGLQWPKCCWHVGFYCDHIQWWTNLSVTNCVLNPQIIHKWMENWWRIIVIAYVYMTRIYAVS